MRKRILLKVAVRALYYFKFNICKFCVTDITVHFTRLSREKYDSIFVGVASSQLSLRRRAFCNLTVATVTLYTICFLNIER